MIWIDAKRPSQWENTIVNQLGETWKTSEGLKDSDIWPQRTDKDFYIPSIPIDSLSTKTIKETRAVQDSIY